MAQEKKQSKKSNSISNKVIVIAVSIALVALIVILNIIGTDTIYSSEKTDMGFPVTFTSNDIIDVESMKSNIFVLTKKYVTCINKNGETKYDFSFTFSEPSIYVNDKYGIVYDTMSDKYILFDKDGIVRQSETKDNKYIYTAKVTEKGEVLIVTKSSDSACVMYLYDKKAREKFVWSCGDEYIVSADTASNGKKIICGAVGVYNSEIYSKVYVFDISSDTPEREYTVPGSSCIDVKLMGKSAVVTCNDQRLLYDISDDNDDGTSVQFNSKALFFSADEDANTAIITDAPENEEGEYRLSLYNKKNELLYATAIDGSIDDVICVDECVYILQNNIVRQIAKNASDKGNLNHSKKSIGIVKAGGSIYCYYLGGVEKAVV